MPTDAGAKLLQDTFDEMVATGDLVLNEFGKYTQGEKKMEDKIEGVKKFKKRPVVIEAIQWTGENYDKVCQFTGITQIGRTRIAFSDGGISDQLVIPTLEGEHRANLGDFIIQGIKGEFYPCKPDIFEQTYKPVAE